MSREFDMALDELRFAEQAVRTARDLLESNTKLQRKFLIGNLRNSESSNWEVRQKFTDQRAGFRIALQGFRDDLAESTMVAEAWRAHISEYFSEEWAAYRAAQAAVTEAA